MFGDEVEGEVREGKKERKKRKEEFKQRKKTIGVEKPGRGRLFTVAFPNLMCDVESDRKWRLEMWMWM